MASKQTTDSGGQSEPTNTDQPRVEVTESADNATHPLTVQAPTLTDSRCVASVDGLQQLESQLSRLEQLLSDRLDKIDSKQATSAALQRQLQDRLDQLNCERAKNAALLAENEDLRSKILTANDDLQTAHAENDALDEQIDSLTAQSEVDKTLLLLQLAELRVSYKKRRTHMGHIIGSQQQKIRGYEGN